MGPVGDGRNTDSDDIIGRNPQSSRGFLTRWLQPHQQILGLAEATPVVLVGADCERVLLTLHEGEAIVIDGDQCLDGADGSKHCKINAVVRCGNKSLQGWAKMPTEKEVVLPPALRPEVPLVTELPREIPWAFNMPPSMGTRFISGGGPPKKAYVITGVGIALAVLAALLAKNNSDNDGQKPFPEPRNRRP